MTKNNGTPRAVFRVDEIKQGNATLHSFTMTAEQLREFGRVEHFGVDDNGVNRGYDEGHAIAIAEAMNGGAVLLDSICGSLEGDWKIVDGKLIAGEGAYFTIDDGQHRREALELLTQEERAVWSFAIVATIGFTREERLKIFRQQAKRKRIDGKLDLAQRYELSDWRNAEEEAAYRLVLRFNEDPGSPLHGIVVLGEVIGHAPEGINGKGLWTVLTSAMSRRSPLYVCSLEERSTALWNLVMAANDVWPKIWRSETHMLTTSRGIGAIVKLVVSGTEFRGTIGDNFTFESVRRALGYASKFHWTKSSRNRDSTSQISAELDAFIGRARNRDSGSSSVKV